MHSMHIRKYRNFITGYLIADVLFLGARKSVISAKLSFDSLKKKHNHRLFIEKVKTTSNV